MTRADSSTDQENEPTPPEAATTCGATWPGCHQPLDGPAMTRAAEALITRLAARQHGLVTRRQLLDAGLSARQLDRRVASSRLRPAQRGVYQVGPLVSPRAREMAAVLACGPGAHLSHKSAAAVWGLLPPDVSSPVHVTVAGRDRSQRTGIVVHRVPALERSEVTRVDGIPITAPPRTLFDVASVVRGRELEQAVAQAERQGLTRRSELLSVISHHRRRPGVRAMRHMLEDDVEPVLARSEAEERFLALVRKTQLPRPKVNTWIGGHEVDFLWRLERLIVEVDGFAFHSSREKFEGDRRRDADLSAMGFHVLRVTWRQVTQQPEVVLVLVAQALARRGPR